jgi:hypothetical protein
MPEAVRARREGNAVRWLSWGGGRVTERCATGSNLRPVVWRVILGVESCGWDRGLNQWRHGPHEGWVCAVSRGAWLRWCRSVGFESIGFGCVKNYVLAELG